MNEKLINKNFSMKSIAYGKNDEHMEKIATKMKFIASLTLRL